MKITGRPHDVCETFLWYGCVTSRGVETCTVAPSTETAVIRIRSWTSQEPHKIANLKDVTMTMPGHAILDCGAALDCIGEVSTARIANAITASRETSRSPIGDNLQRFKFGSDGEPREASFAVSPPIQIGRPGSKFVWSLEALSIWSPSVGPHNIGVL